MTDHHISSVTVDSKHRGNTADTCKSAECDSAGGGVDDVDGVPDADLCRLMVGLRGVVVVMGPRKTGKTTLVHELVRASGIRRGAALGYDAEYMTLVPPLYIHSVLDNFVLRRFREFQTQLNAPAAFWVVDEPNDTFTSTEFRKLVENAANLQTLIIISAQCALDVPEWMRSHVTWWFTRVSRWSLHHRTLSIFSPPVWAKLESMKDNDVPYTFFVAAGDRAPQNSIRDSIRDRILRKVRTKIDAIENSTVVVDAEQSKWATLMEDCKTVSQMKRTGFLPDDLPAKYAVLIEPERLIDSCPPPLASAGEVTSLKSRGAVSTLREEILEQKDDYVQWWQDASKRVFKAPGEFMEVKWEAPASKISPLIDSAAAAHTKCLHLSITGETGCMNPFTKPFNLVLEHHPNLSVVALFHSRTVVVDKGPAARKDLSLSLARMSVSVPLIWFLNWDCRWLFPFRKDNEQAIWQVCVEFAADTFKKQSAQSTIIFDMDMTHSASSHVPKKSITLRDDVAEKQLHLRFYGNQGFVAV